MIWDKSFSMINAYYVLGWVLINKNSHIFRKMKYNISFKQRCCKNASYGRELSIMCRPVSSSTLALRVVHSSKRSKQSFKGNNVCTKIPRSLLPRIKVGEKTKSEDKTLSIRHSLDYS